MNNQSFRINKRILDAIVYVKENFFNGQSLSGLSQDDFITAKEKSNTEYNENNAKYTKSDINTAFNKIQAAMQADDYDLETQLQEYLKNPLPPASTNLQREDGTVIKIEPTELVEIDGIPLIKYIIYELKDDNICFRSAYFYGHKNTPLNFSNIDEKYKNFLLNDFLSSSRLNKSLKNNYGYLGIINTETSLDEKKDIHKDYSSVDNPEFTKKFVNHMLNHINHTFTRDDGSHFSLRIVGKDGFLNWKTIKSEKNKRLKKQKDQKRKRYNFVINPQKSDKTRYPHLIKYLYHEHETGNHGIITGRINIKFLERCKKNPDERSTIYFNYINQILSPEKFKQALENFGGYIGNYTILKKFYKMEDIKAQQENIPEKLAQKEKNRIERNFLNKFLGK